MMDFSPPKPKAQVFLVKVCAKLMDEGLLPPRDVPLTTNIENYIWKMSDEEFEKIIRELGFFP